MTENENGTKTIQLDQSNISSTASLCRALSSEWRLSILQLLSKKSLTYNELSKELLLSLSSINMHVNILKEADLITISLIPGIHGIQKLCTLNINSVFFFLTPQFSDDSNHPIRKQSESFPVSSYSLCEISAPCGLASKSSFIDYTDNPKAFYTNLRLTASLIWFTNGFLEYHISNHLLTSIAHIPSQIEFSFEICSEAPDYNNNWPSDIAVDINGRTVSRFRTSGDYGGRKGKLNPSWWPDKMTQFGELKRITINKNGCFTNGDFFSSDTIQSLHMQEGNYFTFRLYVDETLHNCIGGINLLGRDFGDYPQDIEIEVTYQDLA